MSTRGRVFVGLSGGVDSSVAAHILQAEGYEVIGVFLRVWQADFLPCDWREERRSAMRAAAAIGIPFITLDRSLEYKQGVVDAMVRAYERGDVPNPDVLCNRQIKFGAFFDYAREHGADFVATGHYARISDASGVLCLSRGIDPEKDQAYFLSEIPRAALSAILLPIGGMKKSDVRAYAHNVGLPTAAKKDSQGLCFLGHVDIPDFLSHFITLAPGDVLDTAGKKIGTHRGALGYALGQRHGFHIDASDGTPLYVSAKDVGKNILTVSPEKPADRAETMCVELDDMNWLADHADTFAATAEYRYHGDVVPVEVTTGEGTAKTVVRFSHPVEPLSPGQTLVLYDEDRVLGGGTIRDAKHAGR